MYGETDEFEHLFIQTHEINERNISLWMEHVVFTWQWWIGVILAIIPWVVWIKFRKKESTLRLLTAGLFIMFIASWLDLIGVQLGLWNYQHKVIPLIPPFIPWNTSLLPVFVMFLLQTNSISSPAVKALIFATFTAFVAEPFLAWIDLYDPVNWMYIYSVPIFFVLYLLSHYLCYGESYDRLK